MLDTNIIIKKWTRSIMAIAIVYIIIMFFGEILSLLYLYNGNLFSFESLEYAFKDIISPSSINVMLFFISTVLLKEKRIADVKKSLIPLILVALVSFNFIFFHHASPVCIVSLGLPILLSILYSDSRLTNVTSILCGILSLIVTAVLFFTNSRVGYEYSLGLLISLAFLLGLTYTSFIMVKLESMKNKLIVDSLKEKETYYQKAIIDGLTKLYNHTAYSEKIQTLIKGDLILAVIDIDHFKMVNDTYGHEFGNKVLSLLGNILNKNNSDTIFAARYGGEEFVILFTDHTVEEVIIILEKLKKTFTERVYRVLNKKVITFSCGLAYNEEDTEDSLFEKADKALYYSKEHGRNKITLYKKGM